MTEVTIGREFDTSESRLADDIISRYGAETAVDIHSFLIGDGGSDIRAKIIAIVKKEHSKDQFLKTYIDRVLGLGAFTK